MLDSDDGIQHTGPIAQSAKQISLTFIYELGYKIYIKLSFGHMSRFI
jgi:hypothetical protein